MKQTGASQTIFRLALPIIAGSILQQLYNTADAMIVGRYLGENRLAAVTVASPIMSLLTFFIYGIGIGMNVLFAQKYGRGNKVEFRETVGTALCAGSLFVLLLSAICTTFARQILLATHAPDAVLADALTYLRIIIFGLIFNFLYNYNSAALLTLGDSKTAFFALAGSSGLNILLDWLFVARLNFGVAGAAIATIIAQCISMLTCTIYVRHNYPILSIPLKDLRIRLERLKELVAFSGASAFQQSVLYGGRLLVQGAVNGLDVSVIAGYGAACRIESFVLAPLEGIASSSASYCAKQVGKGMDENVKDGFLSGVKISMIFNLIISSCIFIFSSKVIPLFLGNISDGAMYGGTTYLRHMAVFYIAVSFTQMLQALFRGLGKLRVTIVNTILQISLRVGITYLLIGRMGVSAVCWGTLLGWLGMVVYGGYHAIRYFRKDLSLLRLPVHHQSAFQDASH